MSANTAVAGGPVFEKDPFNKGASYTNSDTALTKKTLVAASDVPPEGLRIDQISLTSTETANARVIRFYWNDGSTDYLIAAINVPVNSGFDGTAQAVDAMTQLAPNTGFLLLMDADNLKVENVAQLASGKQIDIVARGGKLTA